MKARTRARFTAVAVLLAVVSAVAFTPQRPVQELRSDLGPLVARCAELGQPTSALWHARPSGNLGGLGPIDHTIEAVVVLPPADMTAIRVRHVWTAAPAPPVDSPLEAHLPTGPWLLAGTGVRPCAGYTGPVYVQADSLVVYLHVSTA